MKPKVIHQEAMDYSFRAKQALEQKDYSSAFGFYIQAANLESQVAEFYFDKPELEPTRSIVIRSAAILNLKAGLIEIAKKFIFFGLLNSQDDLIKSQLNNALELAVSLDNMPADTARDEYNYINLLRLRSVHYILEPSSHSFGNSVSLEMIKDFSEGYLQSLKAYAVSKFKKISNAGNEIIDSITKEMDKLINPLITSSAYGSFKFSIANDFLYRPGENKEILDLKANVVTKFHEEIFINPLTDVDIDLIKNEFEVTDVNNIFRPLAKIKAHNASYKVGYYDMEDFNKKFVGRIVNKQRKKLLTVKPITQQDIGELESLIIHKRSLQDGKIHQTTIYKEQLKSYEFDFKTNQIEPSDFAPLILNEEILLNVLFTSEKGFTISFDDFAIEHTDIQYEKTLKEFYNDFYNKVVQLANSSIKNQDEQKDWDIVKKYFANPDVLRK